MVLANDFMAQLAATLGSPRRFVYSASVFNGYLGDDDEGYRQVTAHCVDFEVACDLMDLSLAKGPECVFNPHVINFLEPGLCGDESKPYMSHVTILDDAKWELLQRYSNTEGLSCKYAGVVNGYLMHDVKVLAGVDDLVDTGICLFPQFAECGALSRPDIPFDETKHKRFIQASQAYKDKLERTDGLVRSDVFFAYSPLMYKSDVV